MSYTDFSANFDFSGIPQYFNEYFTTGSTVYFEVYGGGGGGAAGSSGGSGAYVLSKYSILQDTSYNVVINIGGGGLAPPAIDPSGGISVGGIIDPSGIVLSDGGNGTTYITGTSGGGGGMTSVLFSDASYNQIIKIIAGGGGGGGSVSGNNGGSSGNIGLPVPNTGNALFSSIGQNGSGTGGGQGGNSTLYGNAGIGGINGGVNGFDYIDASTNLVPATFRGGGGGNGGTFAGGGGGAGYGGAAGGKQGGGGGGGSFSNGNLNIFTLGGGGAGGAPGQPGLNGRVRITWNEPIPITRDVVVSQYMLNSQHTARSIYTAPLTQPVNHQSYFSSLFNGTNPYSGVIGSNLNFYIVGSNGTLYAFNSNFIFLWAFSGFSFFGTPCIIQNGTMYISSKNGNLYAVIDNGPNASLLWSLLINNLITSPTVDLSGNIYVGGLGISAINIQGSFIYGMSVGGNVEDFAFDASYDTLCAVVYGRKTIFTYKTNGKPWVAYPNYEWYATVSDVMSSPSAIYTAASIGDNTLYVGITNVFTPNYVCAYNKNYNINDHNNPPKWTVLINDTNVSNIAIGADNLIYCTSTDGLNVIDSSNGVLVWQYPIQNPNPGGTSINSTPIVDASNNVIFGARDNYVYSVNGASRTFNWRYPVLGGIQAMPIIGNKGNIFVPTDQGFVYKISESGVPNPLYNAISPMYMLNPRHTGNVLDTSSSTHYYGPTRAHTPISILSNDFVSGNLFVSPSIAIDSSGILYIGTNDGNLYFYDGSCNITYHNHASLNSSNPLYTTPLISPNGTLYIGSDDGFLYQYIIKTAGRNWTYNFNQPLQSSPIIDASGFIYFAAGARVYAIGDAGYNWYNKWLMLYFSTGGNITSSPALGQNGYLYFGSDDGYVYAIDSLNGSLKWKYDASANATAGLPDGIPVHPIYTSAAIDASNNVIIGTGSYMNGVLYSFTKDGVVNWFKKSIDWQGADISPDTQIGPFYNTVAIKGDTIYLSTIAYVYAINRLTGNRIWKYSERNYYYSSPIIDASGTLFFTSIDASVPSDTNQGNGVLHSITDTYDGSYNQNWAITVATPGRLAPPVLGNNRRIYLTGTSNKVYAVY